MPDFGLFLGRFHVLALHLPIGIVVVAVVLDWVARRPRHQELARASPYLWGAAAITAVVTAALGYLHFSEGGFTGPSANAHRFWGTATAIAALLSWWLAARGRRPAGAAQLGAGVVMLALVSITGHYGGNLTHGATYLAEYAPPFLRSVLGAAPRRPRVESVAVADPYFDVVQPLLEQRCGTCHNDDKRRGGFSMGSYDSTLLGGETGPAVVPGNVEGSELLYRIGLSPDDEDFMPAEGKTPLTAQQVDILNWWVAVGAPRDTTVGAVGTPAAVEGLVAAELHLGDATLGATTPEGIATADPELVVGLVAAGLQARQVSQSDPRLVVSLSAPGVAIEAAALDALATAAAEIVDLNLTGTALDDAAVTSIGALPVATHLRLARNELTDDALALLAASPRLEHLNLYGNIGITDAGLETLAGILTLREVFLWQTAVTPVGAERLRAQRPDLTVNIGSTVP